MEENQNWAYRRFVNKGTAQSLLQEAEDGKLHLVYYMSKKTNVEEKNTMQKGANYSHSQMGASIRKNSDYEIEHRAGSRMKHVDALSRYPVMISLTKLVLDDPNEMVQIRRQITENTKQHYMSQYKWTPFELLVGTKMRNKRRHPNQRPTAGRNGKELLEQREFLRNDAKKNIETLQSGE
ncbi:hypothetical protein TNCV_164631 [Trichonephila clavipes]|nr:hypothetical protein TNCV_164631 [Trichonephila clavipes]